MGLYCVVFPSVMVLRFHQKCLQTLWRWLQSSLARCARLPLTEYCVCICLKDCSTFSLMTHLHYQHTYSLCPSVCFCVPHSCHFLPMCPCASYFPVVGLSFSICKMGIVTVPTHKTVMKNKWIYFLSSPLECKLHEVGTCWMNEMSEWVVKWMPGIHFFGILSQGVYLHNTPV